MRPLAANGYKGNPVKASGPAGLRTCEPGVSPSEIRACRQAEARDVTGERIKLYRGDALRVMRGLPSGTYDAVITDPPYAAGVSLSAKGASTASKYCENKRGNPLPDFEGDAMDQRTWTLFMTDVLRDARRLCVPGAVCAVFIDWRMLPSLTDAMQRAGWIWRGVAVWDKLASRPQKGRFRQQAEFLVWGSAGRLPVDRPVPVLPGVFHHVNVATGERLHQVQKPLELMREVVKICVPGGRVLDPFAGSGSTLLAAALEDLTADGIESSEAIARTAAERLGVTLQE